MTAPDVRRPLPALAFIAALCVLTAVVWFRVLHRTGPTGTAAGTPCPTPSVTAAATGRGVLPVPGQVSVRVLNSTTRPGLAATTRTELQRRGFTVVGIGNDGPAYGGHGQLRGVGEIRYASAGFAAARLVSFYFPHAALRRTAAAGGAVVVSLGTGFHALAPQAAVTAAIRAAHLTQRPTVTASPSPSCAPSS